MQRGRGGGRGGFDGGRGRGGGGPRAPPTFRTIPAQESPVFATTDITAVPPKQPASLTLNAFAADLSRLKPVHQYELRFFSHHNGAQPKDLSDQLKKDNQRMRQKLAITCIYDVLLNSEADFFNLKTGVHVYDRMRMYFCSEKLEDREFTIPTNKIDPETTSFLYRPDGITATLKYVGPVEFGDVKDFENRRVAEMYIDAVLSQSQLDDPRFVVYGADVYDLQSSRIVEGLDVKDGHHKATKVLDQEHAVVLLEPKKAAFHLYEDVLKALGTNLGVNRNTELRIAPWPTRIATFLKGLVVETKHLEHPRRFVVHDVEGSTALEKTLDDGTTVAAYFTAKYSELAFPHFPLVVEKHRKGRLNYYPLEVLKLAKGQRVTRGGLSKVQNAAMIREHQMVPSRYLENMNREVGKASISNDNPYLKTSSLKVADNYYETTGKLLFPPTITYSNTAKELTAADWRFDISDHFVVGGEIKFLMFASYHTPMDLCRSFGSQLVKRGREAGMNIHIYDFCQLANEGVDDIKRHMLDLKSKTVDFLFVIGDGPHLHDNLKAAEKITQLTTQQIVPQTAERTGGSTFENILMKLNLKVGGVNQGLGTSAAQMNSLNINGNLHKSAFAGTLCIGFDIAHPGSRNNYQLETHHNNEPSVLGYCYSTTENANITHGGYIFIRPRQTVLDKVQLYRALKPALEDYQEKLGRVPKRVFIFRGAVSDPEFDKISTLESKAVGLAIREILQERADPSISMPSLTMVAISKQHNMRLLRPQKEINPADKAPAQNVPPGTLLNHTITNKDFHQFVFVAHKSIQGCAKPCVGTIVAQKGASLSNDLIEQMTINMCFHHEIVPLGISVPAPVASAGQLAARGQRNLAVLGNGSLSDLSDSNDNPNYINQFYLDLTDQYGVHEMSHRFWA
uniref:Piwi domain-containing protein n=1 Tax=Panagrolaimus sp. JU765 TaxID=591449 RepID=A0AC34QQZ2_9BILA